jgi:CDP-diacylglycerol--glycerol-3-phosphate 3-phosphatidyltransferase
MSEENVNISSNEQKTFTDKLRGIFKGLFLPVAKFLTRMGIKPNAVTLAGLVGHFGAAALAVTGHMTWAGIVILLMAPMDFLDGTMARLRGESSRFGAFVDSVTDRYSEFVIMGGLLIYFLMQGNWHGCGAVFLAATGSVMVSYIRSKAEGLGYEAKIGLLSRVERYIILVPGLVFNFPEYALWIIGVFAHFTALQRIVSVRKQAHAEIKNSSIEANQEK